MPRDLSSDLHLREILQPGFTFPNLIVWKLLSEMIP